MHAFIHLDISKHRLIYGLLNPSEYGTRARQSQVRFQARFRTTKLVAEGKNALNIDIHNITHPVVHPSICTHTVSQSFSCPSIDTDSLTPASIYPPE